MRIFSIVSNTWSRVSHPRKPLHTCNLPGNTGDTGPQHSNGIVTCMGGNQGTGAVRRWGGCQDDRI